MKTGAINFGRAAVESLVPPYFHTQGGLQKYVGGATCDVTCVRGLVDGTWAEIVFFFLLRIMWSVAHTRALAYKLSKSYYRCINLIHLKNEKKI